MLIAICFTIITFAEGTIIMRCIAFGMGKIYKSCCNDSIKEMIIAYTDNAIACINEFEEKPVIKPSQIQQLQYDYIIIFSKNYFEEIFTQLVNIIKVPEKKIISYLDIVQGVQHIVLQNCGQDIIEIIKKMQWLRILDYTAFFSNLFYSRDSMKLDNVVRIDAYLSDSMSMYRIFNNIYEKSFFETCELPFYDVIIWAYALNGAKRINEELAKKIKKSASYLLIILPYKCSLEGYNTDSFIEYYGKVIYSKYSAHGKIIIIDMKNNRIEKSVKIYTVSHKAFSEPQDTLYEPIYVGEYGKKKELNDSRGDNISKYNLYINETTALYWIWKHSREDYIGLCHYRRFFLQDENNNTKNILSTPFVDAILEKFDIILPQPIIFDNIKEQLKKHVDSRAFQEGWKIITYLIKKKQPDYLDSFNYFFNHCKVMYPCNMFVTRKEIIDSYCDWLFSFILEAVEALDFSIYDNYSKRMIGFFVERLFNVWLLKQGLRIKELPILLKEEV